MKYFSEHSIQSLHTLDLDLLPDLDLAVPESESDKDLDLERLTDLALDLDSSLFYKNPC